MNKQDVRILIADNETGMRDFLSMEIGSQGYQVQTARDGEEVVERVKREKFHLLISDVKLPKMDGLAALEAVKRIDPDIEAIITTGFGTIESAVEAMKRGAYDFIQKPFTIDEILVAVEKALEKSDLKTLLAVYEVSQAIFSTVETEKLFPIVMDRLQQIIHADETSLMLVDSDNEFRIAASRGVAEGMIDLHLAVGKRIAARANEFKKGLLMAEGLHKDPEFLDIEFRFYIQSSIVFPLFYQDRLLGVLSLHRTHNPVHFTATDFRNVSIFASELTLAAQNAQLYRRLQAKIDEAFFANQKLKGLNEELKRVQSQLVEVEKAKVIAQLAAGVAHEVRNPLSILLQGINYLSNGSGLSKPKTSAVIADMECAIQRADSIMKDLLNLTKPTQITFSVEDIHQIIERSTLLVKNLLDRLHIKIVKNFPKEPVRVRVDLSRMVQVFVNLFSNAAEAMENGGQMTIRTFLKNETVVIEVEDTGKGIDENTLPRVFDPFFTTKRAKGGMGLGLAIVRNILRLHDGSIRIKSQSGGGSTAVVTLPVAVPEPVSPKELSCKE